MPGVAKGAYYYPPFPLTMAGGTGCILEDIDGHRYRDFAGHHTAQILGHGHPAIVDAVVKQSKAGIATGAPMGLAANLAEEICARVDSVEQVRFCNSGTEASLHAIRLARAFTGKPKIAKFEGGYHGSHDGVEISVAAVSPASGSAEAPRPVPTAKGMASSALEDVLILPYDDEAAVESLISTHRNELAAVLLDPKCGLLPQRPGFIRAIREITQANDVLLIFDEIVGFRAAHGGMQSVFGISPDLTLFGKIIGGGFPVGAFGGRADLMSLLDPTNSGPVFQSGTFSGHPVVMAAGLAMLRSLTENRLAHVNRLTDKLTDGLTHIFTRRDTQAQAINTGSVFSIYFMSRIPRTARDVTEHSTEREHDIFIHLLNSGFFLGNGTRMCSVSSPMEDNDIDELLQAVDQILV
jgi:glutamate-1-semialdehyde 2,1-aminomutase